MWTILSCMATMEIFIQMKVDIFYISNNNNNKLIKINKNLDMNITNNKS